MRPDETMTQIAELYQWDVGFNRGRWFDPQQCVTMIVGLRCPSGVVRVIFDSLLERMKGNESGRQGWVGEGQGVSDSSFGNCKPLQHLFCWHFGIETSSWTIQVLQVNKEMKKKPSLWFTVSGGEEKDEAPKGWTPTCLTVPVTHEKSHNNYYLLIGVIENHLTESYFSFGSSL